MATRSHQFVDDSKMSCHSNTFYSCFVASLFQIQSVKLSCSHFSPLTEPRARQERENHAHFRRINTSDINRAFGCIIQGWRYRGFLDKLNFFIFLCTLQSFQINMVKNHIVFERKNLVVIPIERAFFILNKNFYCWK